MIEFMFIFRKRSAIILFACLLMSSGARCQLSFLGQLFHFQDGIYGMKAILGVQSSPDRKNILVSSGGGLSVFTNDTLNHKLVFTKSYLYDDNGQVGIYDAKCARVSHDNRHVYTISFIRDYLSIFDRDTANGNLSLYKTIDYNDYGDGGTDIVISDDDRFVYVNSESGNSVSVFHRDTLSGDLSFVENQSPATTLSPTSIRLSADNNFLYATYLFTDNIAVFSRNTDSGLLTLVQIVNDNENGVQGLYIPRMLQVSGDNKSLYASTYNTIVVFDRNISTGELSYVSTYKDNVNGIDGLDGVYCTAVSPDGRNFYTGSLNDTSLVIFDRNPADGTLSFKRQMNIFKYYLPGGYTGQTIFCDKEDLFIGEFWSARLFTFLRDTLSGDLTLNKIYQNGDGATIEGLYNPSQAIESPDGKNIYSLGAYAGITVFAKEDTTGKLVFKRVIKTTDATNNWSKSVTSLAVSADNHYIYAISNEKQICVFERDIPHDSLILINIIPNLPETHLFSVYSIIRSPDGRYFYVASRYETKLARYEYNPANGSLLFIKTDSLSNHLVDALINMRFTPNGKLLFAPPGSVLRMPMCSCDSLTGEISILNRATCFPDQSGSYIWDYNISPDGKTLYAINAYDRLINAFDIDYANDTLIHVQALFSPDIKSLNEKNTNMLEFSNDSRFAYLSSKGSDNLKVFFRDTESGILTFLRTFTEKADSFEGLEGVSSMIAGRNNRTFYMTSKPENSISAYKIRMNIGPDISACDGDTISVSAGPYYVSYAWSNSDTGSDIKIHQSGTYSVSVTDLYGNVEYDTLQATFYPLPELDLGADAGICSGDSVALDAGAGPATYSWNSGDTTQLLTVSAAGNYFVKKTSEHGCLSTDSVTVRVFPLPVPDLGVDTTVYKGKAYPIDIPGFESYLWYDGSTASSVIIDSASFVTNPLTAWVMVKNENQCANSDTVVMTYIDSGIGIATEELPGLLISPNPFGDFLTIKCGVLLNAVELFDASGKSALKLYPNSETVLIPTETIQNGLYLLHFKIKDKDYFFKVICRH